MSPVDTNKVLNSSLPHRIVKKAARKMKREMYFLPSSFFKSLTDHDSEILSEWAGVISDNTLSDESKTYEYQQMIILSQILSMAEGVPVETEDDAIKVMRQASIMCIANNLHRKNLVRCYYNNLMFGDDGKNLVVMERLDDN